MFIFRCTISVLLFVVTVYADTWYQGCYRSNTSRHIIPDTDDYWTDSSWPDQVVGCGRKCNRERHTYFFTGVKDVCRCYNGSVDKLEKVTDLHCRLNTSTINGNSSLLLPVGEDEDFVALYTAMGPYVDHVILVFEEPWIVVNSKTVLEINVKLSKHINLTDTVWTGSLKLSIQKDLADATYDEFLSYQMPEQSCDNISLMNTGNQLYTVVPISDEFHWKVPVVFHLIGNQSVGVLVTNGLSSLSTEITVQVHDPEPRNLQVVIQVNPENLPSCIPESFNPLEDVSYKIFVNAEFIVEASVSHGNNLTFGFLTSDEDGVVAKVTKQPCDLSCASLHGDGDESCRDVKKVFVFDKPGVYSVTVSVENEFGILSETKHMVVMEERLSNLTFSLLSDSAIVQSGKPIKYQVSLEIRSRIGTSFEIQFFKGHSYFGTLEDSNSTDLSINISHLETSIVSSYGEKGCMLVFQFNHKFKDEGSYKPEFHVHTNKNVSLTAELDSVVTVVNRLEGACLQFDPVAAVNQTVEITLDLAVQSLNMSIAWVIQDDYRENIANVLTTDPYLQFTFMKSGSYLIKCYASNIMGGVNASKLIHVQNPVSGIDLICDEHLVMKVGQVSTCSATITEGTNPEFYWKVSDDYDQVSVSVASDNMTSDATITYDRPGNFNITVIVKNNISRHIQSYDHLVTIQTPITYVIIKQKEPNRAGEKSELKIITSQRSNKDIELEFDFGKGRVQYNFTYEVSRNAYYLDYVFNEAGVHNVTVFAFNDVSMVTSGIDVMVEEPIDRLEIKMDRAPSLGVPAVFVLKTEGSIVDRADLIYSWEFSDGTQHVSTSSVISKNFSSSGIHAINFTARNLVSEYKRSLQVEVSEEPSTELVLLHETVVPVNQLVKFKLLGDNSFCEVIDIKYGDQFAQALEKPVGKWWTHSYKKPGTYEIKGNCTGTSEELIESWIVVEEQVGGLKLEGPKVVEIQGLGLHHHWEAIIDKGSNLFYLWDFGGESFYSTYNKFSRGFDLPGEHIMEVTAYNDISEDTTSIPVFVQYPIVDVQLLSLDVVIGNPAQIILHVTGGKPFNASIDFGDGSTQSLSSDDAGVAITTIDPPHHGMPKYQVVIYHEYGTIGDLLISMNVSNVLSYRTETTWLTTHEPIDNITLMTDSPEYFAAGESVTVTATVGSGKNLQFKWNFNDIPYSKTVIRSRNNTSTATHTYEYSIEEGYEVKVMVSNNLYVEPVFATLPFKFMPVDAMEVLELLQPKHYSSVLAGKKPNTSTEPILFEARCQKGSHIKFIFHFGDGNSATVNGQRDMFYMFTGRSLHSYTQEGVYQVYVTAVNPLGNITLNLSHPFVVRRPPQLPKLNEVYHIPYGQNYTFKVEQFDDDDVTFDWKFGDQTEVVSSQSTEISHFYQKAGVYNLVVIANDKRRKTNDTAKVFVEHKIQGVTVNISKGSQVKLTAHVFPTYQDLVEKYLWNFTTWTGYTLFKRTAEPYIFHSDAFERCFLTVTVENNISRAVSPPIHIPARIHRLRIEKLIRGLTNQTSRFKATSYEGTEMILEWNFGDGSPILRQNETGTFVDHIYTKQGAYMVTVLATNLISRASATLPWFVTNQRCDPPEIFIHDSTFTKVNVSDKLVYEIEFGQTMCENTTIVAEYQWTVYKKSSHLPLFIDGMDRKRFTKRRLMLPPCTLAPGHYRLEVKVGISSTIVFTKKHVDLEVLRNPVVAVIRGGMVRDISRKDMVVLDGSLSSEMCCFNKQEIKYKWNCSRKFTPSQNSCFKEGAMSDLHFNSSVMLFPADRFALDMGDPVITLEASNGNTSSTAVQVLQINNENEPLMLSIHCPQCENHKINANEKLILHAVCINCSEETVEYRWSVLFVHLQYYPRLPTVTCYVKKVDGSNFNLMRLADNRSYTDMAVQEENSTSGAYEEEESGIQSRLINNDAWRKKRELPTYQIPIPGPALGEGKRSRSRSQRVRSREMSRHYHWFPGTGPADTKIMDGVVMVEEGKSTDRHGTKDYQVETGVNTITPDGFRHEWSQRPRPKLHILQKKIRRAYLRDDQTSTGTNKQSLVIKPGYFRQGFDYIIQVRTKMKGRKTELSAMTSFSINSSPSKGECEIYPESGMELITEFRIYCKAWQDEDKPLQYEVSVKLDDDDGMSYILYHGLNHGVNFTLPAGDPSKNQTVTVDITVLDSRMARTLVCTHPTKVRPIALEPRRRLDDLILNQSSPLSPDGKLAVARRQGDGQRVKGVILALSRCLQRLVKRPAYEKVKVTSAIQNMLEELSQQPIRDELEILQTVQALEGLVAVGHEFEMDAIEKTIHILNRVAAKVLELRSPTIDQNLYKLLHKITSYLIEILSPQETLVDEWLQQSIDKQVHVKPDLEILDFQNGNSDIKDKQSLKNLNFKDEVLSGNNHTDVDSSVIKQKLNNSFNRAPVNKNTEARKIGNHEEFIGSFDNASTNHKPDLTNVAVSLAGQKYEDQIRRMFHGYLEAVIQVHHSLLQKEMVFHTQSEGELQKNSQFVISKAMKFSLHDKPVLEINQSKIALPEKMEVVLKMEKSDRSKHDIFLPYQDCFQVHMTKFNFNPYRYNRPESEMIESEVCSVNVLTCNGSTVDVNGLAEDNMVHIEIPRHSDKEDVSLQHRLDKAMMNIHNFNVTRQNRNNSLNLEIDLIPVTAGRLFTVAVLMNYNSPPTPSKYIWREEIKGDHLKIFFHSGYLNFTGDYFIGLVDTGLNKGRPRAEEITHRNYTLKLWWNKCLFWNESTRHWSDNGCWATDQSSYHKTHCRCNHMTTFGSHFELIPNDLSKVSVEDFFDLNENPVTIVLTGVISLVYILLMFFCHRLDKYDVRKGGITYLMDNNLADKQKYEVAIETGLRRGAGTTAKVSVILHGEEGMSETRELISDEDRPLFERNSRDKFILTLPDSIGKIWKVQLWHNNYGMSPSWYLSRVIVKDLNTNNTYYFISEKWLAVEEEDGKVEREFMALEGNLDFRKVFWAKGSQYFSDYHLWLSLLTCPSNSQFNRKQRLTCCLTLLMMYMCLNAMWYKQTTPEYRGEFGLLDVSLRNIAVGATCCAIVIPISFLIVLLFRRSKTQQSTSYTEPILDEEKENEQFPSGKPNEHVQEEEEVESVQPIMTYSILDQSILNWPSIQDWAQKQWVKRHQGYQETPSSPEIPPLPNQMVQRRILGSEIDQASSGFEDSNSTDPRRQINVSSLNSSLKIKAPSISSSTSSHKRSTCSSPKVLHSRVYLPFWCQYIAWFLCASICCTCAVVTVMYGFRFGVSKSVMWLQSLYFSFIVCVFITQPFIIIIAVVYTAIRYRNNPSILDHYEEGEFGEKAKMEILRRKKEQVQYTEQEEFERGVAARQRSRYLRFARPPQEKQLIEARKKIMKEKKAMSLIRESGVIVLMLVILCIMVYGKDTQSPYYINEALKNCLIRSGPVKYNHIKFGQQWYDWSQKTMLDILFPPNSNQSTYQLLDNSYIIGQIQLRQLKVTKENCYNPHDFPLVPDVCYHDYSSSNQMTAKGDNLTEFKEPTSNFNIFGRHGIYDDSGFFVVLNKSRLEAQAQLQHLQQYDWIDNQTRAIFLEFTLFNAPTNLFTSVVLLLEVPSSGGAYPDYRIRSTYLYRYITKWDNFVLACELMFIILTVYKIGVQLCDALKTHKYLFNFWVVLRVLSSTVSLLYMTFYIYRFVLVSDMVDRLRSTYFSQFVDVSFLAFWDEIIRCLLGIIFFLAIIKSLKLLHYSKLFAMFGNVYKRLRRELIAFMAMFFGSVLIFSRIGTVLFGTFVYSFSNVLGSILTVTALLTGIYEDYPMPDSTIIHTIRIFVLFFSVFATGFITSYMVAVLSYRMKVQKHKHSVALVMNPRETILFYWRTFLLWTGIQSAAIDEEPDTVLPAEFTMAEVEYQVDELFFRINTLTGSHGLPEKPMSYFTDSDGTYGLGDDGISSGGSEINLYDDEVLVENRDNLIEETVCFHEPYLAQLLKRDSSIRGRERQIRTHLEMEIVKQLQNQKNILNGKGTWDNSKLSATTSGDSSKSSATTSGNSSEMTTPFGDRKTQQKTSLASSLLQHQTVVHADISQLDDTKLCQSKPDQTGTYQIKPDLSSSSSNPDSPDEQLKNTDRVRLLKEKSPKKTKQEDTTESQKSKSAKKPEPPHKPTFHNQGLREVQSQDPTKSGVLNSPALKQLRSSLRQAIEQDRYLFKCESGGSVATESSSGSEQDAIHGKVGPPIKRNLRKTKSRGKGKGSVNLTSVLLDDLDTSNDENGATGTSYKISETEPILEQENAGDY